ncbi:hypothetical protein [Streptomyces sp. NPDC018610]|uniref:hypothetical protein n=1 Tax=Streptomyces sp. NPDC018610 TaxID=3365049 RepID=UPI003794AE9B
MARVHRTTTTATLLVTVAVSALTGCVTVQRTPVSDPAAGPARPPAPRPDGTAGPGALQAPAREALGRVGPSRREETATPRPATEPSDERQRPESPRSADPLPPPPAPRHRRAPQVPRADIPDIGHSVPGNTGVCALGREYGHWPADSPQARICGQAYGR